MARIITPEVSRQLAMRRKELGSRVGRPKGSLSPKTIQKIKDKASLEEAARKRAGRILNNLLLSSDAGDTQASKEIFDRAFGKTAQEIKVETHHIFSLAELASSRHALPSMLGTTADAIILPTNEEQASVPYIDAPEVKPTDENAS